jgi:hypothetical protein
MTINNISAYIIKHYPKPNELSKARLNKIIYLIDWKNVLTTHTQMTSIEWKYNHYGPYVDIIENTLRKDSHFKFYETSNIYGTKKTIIQLKDDTGFQEPNANEKRIIDFIIEKTRRFNFNEFIKLVYSTYPIISQPKGSKLNLIELANEYNIIKKK